MYVQHFFSAFSPSVSVSARILMITSGLTFVRFGGIGNGGIPLKNIGMGKKYRGNTGTAISGGTQL